MRQIIVGNYTIDIFVDSAYSPTDSVHKYDVKYFDDDYYQYTTIIGIKIHESDELLKSAAVGASGGGTGIYDTSFIYEADRIIICCADTVFCLSIPDLNLFWKTKADSATCFEVYKYKTSYIVHGELEITRLGHDGEIIWQQSGADIFTTQQGNHEDFVLAEDYILATDWENRKYKFDFDGNLI